MAETRRVSVPFWTYDQLGELTLAGRQLPEGLMPLIVVDPAHPALTALAWSVRLTNPFITDLGAIADYLWHGHDGDPVPMLAVRQPGDMGVPSVYRFKDPDHAMPFAQAFGGRTELVEAGPIDWAYFDAWEARPGFADVLRRGAR